MKENHVILTKEERDILVLAAKNPGDKHLSNDEIAQHLGMSVNKVKIIIHQACIKMGAHNRNEALLFAIRRGMITLNDVYSIDEIAEFLWALCPGILRRIACLIRGELKREHLLGNDEQIFYSDKKQDMILTKTEQDILILVGRGLTSKEIADTLYISTGTVRTFLHRACTKLGAHKRTDAAGLAVKRREISIGEMYSLNELLEFIVPLGAESVEKIAQLVSKDRRLEAVLTGN